MKSIMRAYICSLAFLLLMICGGRVNIGFGGHFVAFFGITLVFIKQYFEIKMEEII